MAETPDIVFNVDDDLPEIEKTLFVLDDQGLEEIFDLTGATIKFLYRLFGTTTYLEVTSVNIVGDPTQGTVNVDMRSADLSVPGFYAAKFEVTLGAGEVETFPNRQALLMFISKF